MIGFKCKVGYAPSGQSWSNINLSDFTWLDEGYWTIGTHFNDAVGRNENFNGDIISQHSLLESAMGRNDLSTMWLVGSASNAAPSSYAQALLPWCFTEYPTLNSEEVMGRTGTLYYNRDYGVYLISLKRFLRFNWSAGDPRTAIYKVLDNGKLSNSGLGTQFLLFSFNYCGQSFRYGIVDNYKEPSDLLDADKYISITAHVNTTDIRDLRFSDSSGLTDANKTKFSNILYDVFSDFVNGGGKPDFDDSVPVNPYEPSTPSGPGDLPPGTFDFESDPIPDSPLPTLSAANTGFTRIYNPTLSQVQSLARYLWTDTSVIDTIWNHLKQFFEDPMQAMIGFNLVPCTVPDAGSEEFALMYIGTGVYMNVAASQFVDVDCGTLELERVYGSALDQSPYTKVHCFLPYIGTVQLNTDEIMGTTLQVKYRIDIVSGSCVAKIFVDDNVLYQYSGHCAITIPFSSADFSSYVNAAIQVAKLGITSAANAGLGALAAAAGEAAQETGRVVTRTTETRNTMRNPATGRQVTRSTQTVTHTTEYPQNESQSETKASFAGLSPANVSNTVGQIMSSKPHILHSGSFSGNSGYLGVRRPYLIIERPNMCLPENYQSLNGYPSMITMVLGECVGYTRVQQVQLTGIWATNPEQAEILELLKMGVVF